MGTSLQYTLSTEADSDLVEIFDYTVKMFGEPQAIAYLTSIEVIFEAICSNPGIGRERNEVVAELRSLSYESHTIFYRIMNKSIRIVRVLHSSRDIFKFL